jgi:hypothetical protein
MCINRPKPAQKPTPAKKPSPQGFSFAPSEILNTSAANNVDAPILFEDNERFDTNRAKNN